jgi:hypothetical protein
LWEAARIAADNCHAAVGTAAAFINVLHGSRFTVTGQGTGADPDSLSEIYPRFTREVGVSSAQNPPKVGALRSQREMRNSAHFISDVYPNRDQGITRM